MFGIITGLRQMRHAWHLWKTYVYRSKNTFGISPLLKLKTNLSGFTADQYTLYDLEHNDLHKYITEFERWKGENVNGVFAPVMSEKILLSNLFDDINTPKIFFWVDNGIGYDSEGIMAKEKVFAQIRKQGKIIAKPTHSFGHGFGMYIISIVGGQYYINDEPIAEDDLYERITLSEDYIFTQFIVQNNYARMLYPKTTNTIRIISIWRKEEANPKIILAGQRIGTDKSGSVDSVAAGGLSVLVDISTGTLGCAKNYANQTYSNHPDTGSQIEGIVIPHWEKIKEKLVQSHKKRRYFRFIAWDVIVTEDDFYICEVNRGCGLGMFQIFGGLKNTELGELYREYEIIK